MGYFSNGTEGAIYEETFCVLVTTGVLYVLWRVMTFTADQFAAWWNGRGERS